MVQYISLSKGKTSRLLNDMSVKAGKARKKEGRKEVIEVKKEKSRQEVKSVHSNFEFRRFKRV